MQARLRLAVFCFFVVSMVLLFYVRYKSCRAYEQTWLGLLPLQASVPSYLCLCLHAGI